MSHNVVPPLKSPAPPADEAMTLWKRLKRLGTLVDHRRGLPLRRYQQASDEGASVETHVGRG